MKKILISQAVYKNPSRQEEGDLLDSAIMRLLQVAGYFPIPVSNFYFQKKNINYYDFLFTKFIEELSPDGLLLSGGADIGIYEERDLTEEKLLTWFASKKLPALGLCLGMQLMGTLGGGKLEKIDGHISTNHFIDGLISDTVNSFHQYAFKYLPSEYVITAQTNDKCIEAFRHDKKNWQGWMWHPEREEKFKVTDLERIRGFFG
jgi:putative glutamine amidotransferase